jgi:hypothetical protein
MVGHDESPVGLPPDAEARPKRQCDRQFGLVRFSKSRLGLPDVLSLLPARDQVAAELTGQAKSLAEPGALAAAMPPCLLLLEASGL